MTNRVNFFRLLDQKTDPEKAKEASEIIKKMMSLNPEARPSAA